MFNFSREELHCLRRLDRPWKIQDFLVNLPMSWSDEFLSPRRVLIARRASCMDGALFAAAVLWVNGERPLLLDLRANDRDDDHVVALFRRHGRWGAISKTNHAVLRYRDPIYRNIRELACSYFHEYFLDDGEKTLREYSRPFALARYGHRWVTATEDLRWLADALDASRHISIVDRRARAVLRASDPIEINAGKLACERPPRSAAIRTVPRRAGG